MKKIILSFLFISAIVGRTMAQEKPAAKVEDNPNAAEIYFETELHDYGTINKVRMVVMNSNLKILGKSL